MVRSYSLDQTIAQLKNMYAQSTHYEDCITLESALYFLQQFNKLAKSNFLEDDDEE